MHYMPERYCSYSTCSKPVLFSLQPVRFDGCLVKTYLQRRHVNCSVPLDKNPRPAGR